MNDLHEHHHHRKNQIRQRLAEFTRIQGDDLFYELCFCLLTPQSNGRRCWTAVEHLKQKDFLHTHFNPKPLLKKTVRFHNTKTQHLLTAKQHWPTIHQRITSDTPSEELRTWLVTHVKGFGLKEASHYLRNTGHRNLAILDRHVLKNLQKHHIIKQLPKTLTKKKYLSIEKKFQHFAEKIKIPMDELDLLFWSNETGEVFK